MDQPGTVRHPVFARVFRALALLGERAGLGERRAQLVDGLVGTVVEVGCGDGSTFAHYPPGVERVVAVEPEPSLRAHAVRRSEALATERGLVVEVREGVAEALPVPDASADAVVLSLVLCSVADVEVAVAEVARVLRPGGEVRLMEHVAAEPGTRLAAWQERLDRRVWPALFGGCHTHRDPLAALEGAGLRIERVHRAMVPARPRVPVSPHVVAVARKPAT
ncbi:class I SAM-dependent methyltransferase [Alteromonas gracilis]